jgi:uncharacterized repeat protein (TIGR01451 family)
MRLKTSTIVLPISLATLGILALLWLLRCPSTSSFAVHARAAPSTEPHLTLAAIRYVAITGTDFSDCSTPAGACRTLQYAVDHARPGDEIRVASGVYTDVQDRPAPIGYDGLAVIPQAVYITKTLALRGGYTTTDWLVPDPIANPTTLDAQDRGRVILVFGAISATIEGLRVTGGDSQGLGGHVWDAGGGVFAVTATVTLSNNWIYDNDCFQGDGGGVSLAYGHSSLISNTIHNNIAFSGGGIDLFRVTAEARDNVVSANDSWLGAGFSLFESQVDFVGNTLLNNDGGRGGAFYLYSGTATFEGNTIANNVADGIDYGDGGGGVHLEESHATFVDNDIYGNAAWPCGGGLYITRGTATLRNNRLHDNTANEYGGAAWMTSSDVALTNNEVYSSSASVNGGLSILVCDATLDRNRIANNSCRLGGCGLGFDSGEGWMTNNVIADNGDGSTLGTPGMLLIGGSFRLAHNTVARNTGGNGVGVYVSDGYYLGSAVLSNTIIVSQSVGISVTAGNMATLQATLWGTGTSANGIDWAGAGTISTGTVNIWGDPAFVDASGGDYNIGSVSAARDAGIPAGVSHDIDGDHRPMGGGYDIGADEFLPGAYVTAHKQAAPDPVIAGDPITYTLRVANTGTVTLTATITDILPDHVSPTGTLTWTATISPLVGLWTEKVVVTAAADYTGPLTNVLRVSTLEGARASHILTSSALPPNRAPLTPSNPIPANLAIGVPLTSGLSWQGGDPDGDLVTYSIAFGASDPPLLAASGITRTHYQPGELALDTTYYWVVTATDGISATVGPNWRFSTTGIERHPIYLPLVVVGR